MIQYPKLTHTTLPSVEGAFGSMKILRDPPKSRYTTYRPKVGDDNQMLELIATSGDRICETIQPFARGVNPMVSVSYSNFGNNGGQTRGSSGGEAYYPYRIMRDGAFRPPIVAPQDLLPLSRLPRNVTSCATNPTTRLVDLKMSCPTDLKQIREELVRTCAPPRAGFVIGAPAQAPRETGYSVLTPRCSAAQPNVSGRKRYDVRDNAKPERGIIDTPLYTAHQSLPSRTMSFRATPTEAPPVHDTIAHTAARTNLTAPISSAGQTFTGALDINRSVLERSKTNGISYSAPIHYRNDNAVREWTDSSRNKYLPVHQNPTYVDARTNHNRASLDNPALPRPRGRARANAKLDAPFRTNASYKAVDVNSAITNRSVRLAPIRRADRGYN